MPSMGGIMSDDPLHGVMLALGRLEGKQDAILTAVGEQTKRLNAHSDRISKLERRQAWWAGAAAVMGMLATTIGRKMGLVP